MKTENSNRVNMINANITFCDANSTATSGIPAFAIALAAVKAKMLLINSYNQIGEGTTKGVTLDTKGLRKNMSDLALKCANATLAFANSTSNNTLAALVNFTETKLNALKKEDVDDVCQGIHDATNANSVGALNFGIVASDITDLQSSIDLYRVASQNPRQAIISKSQAKKQVANMVREVIDDLLVAQMDKMVNTLKPTNKTFWDGYRQSREILDLGTTTAKVRGTVLDDEDVPLKGVIFSILDSGTEDVVVSVKTDNKGKFNASKLKAGLFDFKWELNGYKPVIETEVKISNGKELKRKVVMVKQGKIVVIEGDVMMGMIQNINVGDIKGTPQTDVTIQVTGSPFRFYASTMPNGTPGGAFLDVQAGQTITKSAEELVSLLGLNDTNNFFNVQNIGAMNGHYKITLDDLQ
ncbi:MAG: carboxypeptidase-like regulatory domain-containing protein [Chitinophagales bacterium]